MANRKLWVLLRSCILALIIFGIGVYPLMHRSLATPAKPLVCLPLEQTASRCFARANKLFGREITAIAISPNGEWLVGADHEQIAIWNLITRQQDRSLSGHHGWITALAFSPDGKTLASASMDHSIKLWNFSEGKPYATLSSPRVTSLAFSPDGQTLATGSRLVTWPDGDTSPGGVQFWNLATRSLGLQLGDGSVQTLAFSPDGQWLASGGEQVQLWQATTGALLASQPVEKLTALAFNPDRSSLVSVGKAIQIWQLPSLSQTKRVNSIAGDLAIAASGSTLATATGGTLFFWQLPNLRFLGGLKASWYSHAKVEFALNSRAIVSASSDGLYLWREQKPWQEQKSLPRKG